MSQTGEFNRTQGKQVMEAFLLAAGDKIDVVYAHNDGMAIGAIQAIKEYGKKPGKDIYIASIDGVRDAFVAMMAGDLNLTVECTPLMGPSAFDAL
jgi:simple sugar transport system substrate-binding protein